MGTKILMEGVAENTWITGGLRIEPEAVFGQIKYDMGYKRFRHFGKDKVTMDFAFFAIAFNIKKMCAKIKNEKMTDKNYQNIRVA